MTLFHKLMLLSVLLGSCTICLAAKLEARDSQGITPEHLRLLKDHTSVLESRAERERHAGLSKNDAETDDGANLDSEEALSDYGPAEEELNYDQLNDKSQWPDLYGYDDLEGDEEDKELQMDKKASNSRFNSYQRNEESDEESNEERNYDAYDSEENSEYDSYKEHSDDANKQQCQNCITKREDMTENEYLDTQKHQRWVWWAYFIFTMSTSLVACFYLRYFDINDCMYEVFCFCGVVFGVLWTVIFISVAITGIVLVILPFLVVCCFVELCASISMRKGNCAAIHCHEESEPGFKEINQ